MSGLWCEHFEEYANAGQLLDGVFAENASGLGGSNGITASNPPRPGALSLITNAAADCKLRRIFGVPKSAAGFGFRYYPPSLPAFDSNLLDGHSTCFSFLAASGLGQMHAFLGSDGAFVICRSGFPFPGDITIVGRSDPCITARTWQYVEMKCVPDISHGSFEVRVNGTTVFTYTGNTDPQVSGEVSNAMWLTRGNEQLADLHAWDTDYANGPSDFTGNVGVFRRELNSDETQADWSKSAGSVGYALLIDKNDATYIQADTVGLKSSFGAADVPSGVTGIIYQQVKFRGQKTDAADCDTAPSLVSSASTETDVVGQHMTTQETWRWGIFGDDPATDAPWTVPAANASQPTVTRTL